MSLYTTVLFVLNSIPFLAFFFSISKMLTMQFFRSSAKTQLFRSSAETQVFCRPVDMQVFCSFYAALQIKLQKRRFSADLRKSCAQKLAVLAPVEKLHFCNGAFAQLYYFCNTLWETCIKVAEKPAFLHLCAKASFYAGAKLLRSFYEVFSLRRSCRKAFFFLKGNLSAEGLSSLLSSYQKWNKSIKGFGNYKILKTLAYNINIKVLSLWPWP